MTKTIQDCFQSRSNNFEILRLAAALMVLWSHSYPLTGATYEPMGELSRGAESGGSLGVAIFFTISGFLVTRSFLERPLGEYLLARFLRIVPALMAVTLFEILIIGPLFTTSPLKAYFSDPHTVGRLANPLVFTIAAHLPSSLLPGVFTSLPNQAVNGSLWTLPVETGFYILLPPLAAAGLLGGRAIALAVAATLGLYIFLIEVHGFGWSHQGPELWAGAWTYTTLRGVIPFLAGAAAWRLRHHIPLNDAMAMCCLVALAVCTGRFGATIAYSLCVPYLVIHLALAHPARFDIKKRIGDLSYGTYLFAFPIQQSIIAALGPKISATAVSALATAIVLPLAFLSWRHIEKPALDLKRRLQSADRREAVVQLQG